MEIRHNISRNLRVQRAALGQNLEEFAETLEISRSMLQKYLEGTGNPRIDTLEQISAKLDISFAELISSPAPEELSASMEVKP